MFVGKKANKEWWWRFDLNFCKKKRHTNNTQFAAGEQKARMKQRVKVKSIMGRDQSKHTACSSKSPGEGWSLFSLSLIRIVRFNPPAAAIYNISAFHFLSARRNLPLLHYDFPSCHHLRFRYTHPPLPGQEKTCKRTQRLMFRFKNISPLRPERPPRRRETQSYELTKKIQFFSTLCFDTSLSIYNLSLAEKLIICAGLWTRSIVCWQLSICIHGKYVDFASGWK